MDGFVLEVKSYSQTWFHIWLRKDIFNVSPWNREELMIIRSYLLRVYRISRSGFETRIVRHENIKAGKGDKKESRGKKRSRGTGWKKKRKEMEERERERNVLDDPHNNILSQVCWPRCSQRARPICSHHPSLSLSPSSLLLLFSLSSYLLSNLSIVPRV